MKIQTVMFVSEGALRTVWFAPLLVEEAEVFADLFLAKVGEVADLLLLLAEVLALLAIAWGQQSAWEISEKAYG